MNVFAKSNAYLRLVRFDKPIGTLLLLWPTLWALWIASSGQPDTMILTIFLIGTVVMRSVGCIMNDIADRDFDNKVTRTKKRPLATGEVTLKEALMLVAVLGLIALFLLLQLNVVAIVLGVIGFCLAAIYPYLKRFTHLPQFALGVAFSWGIPMAFAATLQEVPIVGWLLFAVAAVWPIAYDTIYAMVDREEDIKIGVKSTAILFGKADVPIVMLLQLLLLVSLGFYGHWLRLNCYFYFGLTLATLLSVYQFILIHRRDPTHCFRAFLNNHWIGLSIFSGIFLAYRYPGFC